MTDKTRYRHLETELGNEHPPLIDRDEMLCSSLNSNYWFDAVKDVIREACLHQRDFDIAWYEAAKTASIKEQAECEEKCEDAYNSGSVDSIADLQRQCQARVERIKRKTKKSKVLAYEIDSDDYVVSYKLLEAIWKEEEIGEEEEVLMPYSGSIERKT